MSFSEDTWAWIKTAPLPVVLAISLLLNGFQGTWLWALERAVGVLETKFAVVAEKAEVSYQYVLRLDAKLEGLADKQDAIVGLLMVYNTEIDGVRARELLERAKIAAELKKTTAELKKEREESQKRLEDALREIRERQDKKSDLDSIRDSKPSGNSASGSSSSVEPPRSDGEPGALSGESDRVSQLGQ